MTNRELIATYPWLSYDRIFVDDGSSMGRYELPEDYDCEFTVLDEMPLGWRKAFGMDLVKEIDDELKRQGDEARDGYFVYQIKEKYGTLRWYCNGNSDIQRIIDKYAVVSQNVCMVCGKPDVHVREDGWIWPECRECYEKNDPQQPYENVVDMDDNCKIPDEYIVRKFGENGDEDTVVYIRDIANKIRGKYKEGMI